MAHDDAAEAVPALPEPARLSKGELKPEEYWWRDRQKWLEEQGYMLRPRYQPDWVPSWRVTKATIPYFCEDSWALHVSFSA